MPNFYIYVCPCLKYIGRKQLLACPFLLPPPWSAWQLSFWG